METLSEADTNSPIIDEMPTIEPEVWRNLIKELKSGGEQYFWNLGADLARTNPKHRETFENALRDTSYPENPSMTSAAVLLVLRALEKQATHSGKRLPEIPSPIDPLPALRKFIPISDGTELGIIEVAYAELIKRNPVIDEIVVYMASGAPNELLKIKSIAEGKKGAIYAYYGVHSTLMKT